MKILTTLFHSVLVIALLAIVGLFLASILPIPGAVDVKIVKSGSMEPFIQTGGIVVLQPASSYSVGDVITFGEDTKTQVPTTHRIIGTRTEEGATYFATKGDANEEADPVEVAERAVIGKVLFTVPYAGYLLDFARQPLGFALLIAIPAGLIVLYELIGIVTEVRRMLGNGGETPKRTRAKTHAVLERAEAARIRAAEARVPLVLEDPVLDLRDFRDPDILDLRDMRPGRYI